MNRFFGMMPRDEIKKEKSYKVGAGQFTVTIQAGPNGWTILYADNSSNYEDVTGTTEENFEKAYALLKTQFDNINF